MDIFTRIQRRRRTDRLFVQVPVQVPGDLVEDLKDLAVRKGYPSYEGLILEYIREGIRSEPESSESMYLWVRKLQELGVPEGQIEECVRDVWASLRPLPPSGEVPDDLWGSSLP